MTKDATLIKEALLSMSKDLEETKEKAENYLSDLDTAKPEEFTFGDGELSGGSENEKEPGKGKSKGKKKEVKTVEDAKNMLDSAKEDIQAVIDNIDGLLGQASDETKKVSFARLSEERQKTLDALASKAAEAISDANHSFAHWDTFLAARNPVASISTPSLKQAAEAVQDAHRTWSIWNKIFGSRKEATAVPPTGAKFTGDMFPSKSGDPAKVELKHWDAGASEFHRDTKKENALPNPSVDERLTDAGNPHDEKPYVNASFHLDSKNKYESYWDIRDTKTGKRVVASFLGVPEETTNGLGYNDQTFAQFSSKSYGDAIVENAMERGIDYVERSLVGDKAASQKVAREPKVKDKAKVRKYFSDAFGDPNYAKKMTSAEDGGMNVDYTPEHDTVEGKTDETKKGPGTISSKDPEIVKARAARSVELARKFISRNSAMPFVTASVRQKASEFMKMSDSDFSATERALEQLPIVNEAALKSAHIPDSESGIVGNTQTGVSEPKGTVETEGVEDNVKSDAKVSARVVPQISKTASQESVNTSLPFTTTESKLLEAGVDPGRVRRARYKNS